MQKHTKLDKKRKERGSSPLFLLFSSVFTELSSESKNQNGKQETERKGDIKSDYKSIRDVN